MEQRTISEVRKSRKKTQVDLAKILGINQSTLTRLERSGDCLVSSLVAYIEALGGELDLVVRFPGEEPVEVTGLHNTLRRRPPAADQTR